MVDRNIQNLEVICTFKFCYKKHSGFINNSMAPKVQNYDEKSQMAANSKLKKIGHFCSQENILKLCLEKKFDFINHSTILQVQNFEEKKIKITSSRSFKIDIYFYTLQLTSCEICFNFKIN